MPTEQGKALYTEQGCEGTGVPAEGRIQQRMYRSLGAVSKSRVGTRPTPQDGSVNTECLNLVI